MAPLGTALRNVRSVLRDGGRFVAEMGGSRNIAALDASLRAGLADLRIDAPVVVNTFPTPDEVTGLLEEAGFGVELVAWFIRPTPLESTAAEWTQHFRTATWDAVPPVMRHELVSRVDAHAADAGLLVDGTWFADYCRLRFVARAA
jgi:hypothetical protein